MAQESVLTSVHQIDSDIAGALNRVGACTIGMICGFLPQYTWNQVFAAVDRLSREGGLLITRHGRFDYLISLAPAPLAMPTGHQPDQTKKEKV
jgi:hypothetical protein